MADLAAAEACVGDVAAVSLEDAVFAAMAGDVARADRALALAVAEGAAPVAVLRAALGHVQRLHRARIAMQAGAAPAEAVKAVRPPLFFRREADFLRALQAVAGTAADGRCRCVLARRERLQTHRRAGRDDLPECRAEPCAACGRVAPRLSGLRRLSRG